MGASENPPEALGPLLDGLTDVERCRLEERLRHVREVLTGYASGHAETAARGEPRPEFDPSLPITQRQEAKSAELGVTTRTVRRWVAAYGEAGPAGLLDGRSMRTGDVLSGVDEQWLAMCRTVLAEHTEASRPTKALVLARVARLDAEHGEGVVRPPGVKKARAVLLTELSRGSNAFTGSTKGKRSIAHRPQGVYGRLDATRPGEYLLLDTTPLDVFAMEPLTLRWVGVELTIAMDLFSRTVVGLRLSPVSTKAVDAAAVLFETLRPGSRECTGTGVLPYAGLPDLVVVDAEVAEFGGTPSRSARGAGLPEVAAETIVVDHGKIYLSQHLMSVCERLGVSVQPARPLTPTDKAAVERLFRTLREGLLAALPGYKGPDVHSRGADPEGCTYFFVNELEQVIREWISEIYHMRPHAGLVEPQVPGLELSPAEMFEAGLARAVRLRIPAHPGLAFDFLPTAWRTIQHYGVEVHGLRYDPDDVSRVYFQDPADHAWHELVWEHAAEIGVPFSADTLAYARRLTLASGRHVQGWQALAELLQRWDAGLVRHPAERRLAIRASQLRQAQLEAATTSDADAEVVALPTVAAITGAGGSCESGPAHPPGSGAEPGGEDDSVDELDLDDRMDGDGAGGAGVDDAAFYAEALEVLR